MTRKEYAYLLEHRWALQNRIDSYDEANAQQQLVKEQEQVVILINEYNANELANRVYITREQFTGYLDIPEDEDAEFDESQIGDNDLWCHVCGNFSDSENLGHVWYKYPKGEDSFCCINVCPHCNGWNTVQDVGP